MHHARLTLCLTLLLAVFAPRPAAAGDVPTSRNQHTAIMLELLSDDGWAHVANKGGVDCYKRTMSQSTTPAGMVSKVVDVTSEEFLTVLSDEDEFETFLKKPCYLHDARILNSNKADYHDVYQYLDLPKVLKDRHYVVRLFTERNLDGVEGKHRVWWTLLPRETYEDFITEMDEEKGGPPIYIEATEGSWELEPQDDGTTKVTYRLFTIPGGTIPEWAVGVGNRESMPDMLNATAKEAARRAGK